MIVEKFSSQRKRRARLIPLVVGGMILILALIIDRLGFGQPGSFGIGQFLLILLGLVLVLLGLLGRRIIDLYHNTAIILLNTLLLFAMLELGAIVIGRLNLFPSEAQVVRESYLQLPYYLKQDWAETFWNEAKMAENYRYQPYTIWRHQPFDGQTVNINEQGVRRTPGAECDDRAYKVYIFGGSTMWGWGAPDWGTIPAYLLAGLEMQIGNPVCVINFGEDAFVSTQSLIELIRQLQSGNLPDVVIFYDGINDIYAAYESGQSGVHTTLTTIAAKFENPEHPLIIWLKSSRLFSLSNRLVGELKLGGQADSNFRKYTDLSIDADQLAVLVTATYLSNYRLVGALAQEYGFTYYFFWQPHLGDYRKRLTTEEQAIQSTLDPDLITLVQMANEKIHSITSDYEYLHSLVDTFENQEEQIWIDAWGHLTPKGNHLVAQAMLDVIKPYITRK